MCRGGYRRGGAPLRGLCGAGAEDRAAVLPALFAAFSRSDRRSSFTCSNCADRTFHFECAVARYRSHRRRARVDPPLQIRPRTFTSAIRSPQWLRRGLDDERIRAQPLRFSRACAAAPRAAARTGVQSGRSAGASSSPPQAGAPVLRCLRRTRYTTTQTRLDRDAAHGKLARRLPRATHFRACKAAISSSWTTSSPPARPWRNARASSAQPAPPPCASSPSRAADSHHALHSWAFSTNHPSLRARSASSRRASGRSARAAAR